MEYLLDSYIYTLFLGDYLPYLSVFPTFYSKYLYLSFIPDYPSRVLTSIFYFSLYIVENRQVGQVIAS